MKTFLCLKSTLAGAALVLLAGALGQGCAGRSMVVAATGTVLGLDISENPQTQLYHVKFGYNRGELAIVPSNRSGDKDATGSNSLNNGAADTADVMMELRYGGFGIKTSGGIYQRLAVGKNAVVQPGAAFMMAKDANGELKADTAKAVSTAMCKIPAKDTRARFELLNGLVDTLNALPADKYPDAATTVNKLDSLDKLVPVNWDFTRYGESGGNVTITALAPIPAVAAPNPGYARFKKYHDTLKSSIKVLTMLNQPPAAGAWSVAGAQPTPATGPQVAQAAADLKTQTELLDKIDQKFSENPDVENVIKYFGKMTSN